MKKFPGDAVFSAVSHDIEDFLYKYDLTFAKDGGIL